MKKYMVLFLFSQVASCVPEHGGTPSNAHCLSTDLSGEIRGTLGGNVSLCGDVTISGELTSNAPGIVLEIKPGTVIRMSEHSRIRLDSYPITVKAHGLSTRPITFEGLNAASWAGILLGNEITPDSRLDHVVIRHATHTNPFALSVDAPITLNHVIIRESWAGIDARNFNPFSENLSIDVQSSPARLRGEGAITNFPLGGTVESQSGAPVEVDLGGLVSEFPIHFRDLGVPYRLAEEIRTNSSFNVDAGVEIFASETSGLQLDGPAKFAGTAEKPILLQQVSEDPDAWFKLSFNYDPNTGMGNNVELSHVEIRRGAVTFPISTLDHVSCVNCSAVALGGPIDATALSLTGNPDLVLELWTLDTALSIPTNSNLELEQISVLIPNFETSGVLRNFGAPYVFRDGLRNERPITLEIESGAELIFGSSGYGVELGQNMPATLKADNVTFTSFTSWNGFNLGHNMDAGSYIRNSRIEYTSGVGVKMVRPIELTSNTISGLGYCIETSEDDLIDYITMNTLDCRLGAMK